MIDRRLNLTDWLRVPGNLERYRTWVESAETQEIMELVERSFRPQGLGVAADADTIASLATLGYGELAGAAACVNRILNADAVIRLEEDPKAITDREKQMLLADGYTEADINEGLNLLES